MHAREARCEHDTLKLCRAARCAVLLYYYRTLSMLRSGVVVVAMLAVAGAVPQTAEQGKVMVSFAPGSKLNTNFKEQNDPVRSLRL